MNKKELIIVSLTTWSARIGNIPAVLDSIFVQSMVPDKVVLNLAFEEIVPHDIQDYLILHNVEIYRVPDTRVWKKLIPTLRRYPNACVINIDDDFIYPSNMVEDFVVTHRKYPNFPISGNRYIMNGMMCHCGWASLSTAAHFGDYLDQIDEDLMKHCPSDDIACTYLATMAGHPYIPSTNRYDSIDLQTYNEVEPYTPNVVKDNGIDESLEYLTKRFGYTKNATPMYIEDSFLANVGQQVVENKEQYLIAQTAWQKEKEIRGSRAYKLGKLLLKPLKWLKK